MKQEILFVFGVCIATAIAAIFKITNPVAVSKTISHLRNRYIEFVYIFISSKQPLWLPAYAASYGGQADAPI
jgi:hypothetical protein